MPVYTYQCTRCAYWRDHRREVADRDAEVVCGDCGDSMFRVITAPAVHFVGDGFYVNEKGSK